MLTIFMNLYSDKRFSEMIQEGNQLRKFLYKAQLEKEQSFRDEKREIQKYEINIKMFRYREIKDSEKSDQKYI